MFCCNRLLTTSALLDLVFVANAMHVYWIKYNCCCPFYHALSTSDSLLSVSLVLTRSPISMMSLLLTRCDNIDGLNKYKQQTMNNLQFYSCARSQHAHAIRVNWLNIITPPSLISAYPSSPFHRVTSKNQSPK